MRKCNRCNSVVRVENILDYPYYCMRCEENMFEFETYEMNNYECTIVIGESRENSEVKKRRIFATSSKEAKEKIEKEYGGYCFAVKELKND